MRRSDDRMLSSPGRPGLPSMLLCLLLLAGPSAAQPHELERISTSFDGGHANAHSYFPEISDDGRYVAFTSSASNLVAADGNGRRDAFLHDRLTGETWIVSLSESGSLVDGHTFELGLSGDGTCVAFSNDSDLVVPSAANRFRQIYVHDRGTLTTEIVSVSSEGIVGLGRSGSPRLSRNGRWVAFTSEAENLVPDDSNGEEDVFVHDRNSGRTWRVTDHMKARQYFHNLTSFSRDGQFVGVVVGESKTGSSFSRVYAVATGAFEGVGLARHGACTYGGLTGGPKLDGIGRFTAFTSFSGSSPACSEGTHLFVEDRTTDEVELVSVGLDGLPGQGGSPQISRDGRHVVFFSTSDDLVADDTNRMRDVFLRDLDAGVTQRVSVAADGGEANGSSASPAVSSDGSAVTFRSLATNLVPGDVDGVFDIFVFDQDPWFDTGCALPGTAGEPRLRGLGSLVVGAPGPALPVRHPGRRRPAGHRPLQRAASRPPVSAACPIDQARGSTTPSLLDGCTVDNRPHSWRWHPTSR